MFNRIAGHGQSLAIIGTPYSGKTTLLHYSVLADAAREQLKEHPLTHCFATVNARGCDADFSRNDFWKTVLSSLGEIPEDAPETTRNIVRQAQQDYLQSDFSHFSLERVLERLQTANIRLVMLIDDFDVLLSHPQLGDAEFFGSLRSLVTRSQGALVLAISSCLPLSELNRKAYRSSHVGSPYFNFLNEVVLPTWNDEEVETLLAQGASRFQTEDKCFIRHLGATQPWLLKTTAAAVWRAYDAAAPQEAQQRLYKAATYAYPNIDKHFSANWSYWTEAMRLVLISLALQQPPFNREISNQHELAPVLQNDGFTPELRALHKQGMITASPTCPSGWQLYPHALRWWLWKKIQCWGQELPTLNVHLINQQTPSDMTRPQWQHFSRIAHAVHLTATT
ncbi:MAG: AAA family ATPase [Pseudomonadota bacterium]